MTRRRQNHELTSHSSTVFFFYLKSCCNRQDGPGASSRSRAGWKCRKATVPQCPVYIYQVFGIIYTTVVMGRRFFPHRRYHDPQIRGRLEAFARCTLSESFTNYKGELQFKAHTYKTSIRLLY